MGPRRIGIYIIYATLSSNLSFPPGGRYEFSESMASVQDVAGVVRSQRHRFKEPNRTSSTSSETALVNVRHALTLVDPWAGLKIAENRSVTPSTVPVVIQHPHSPLSFPTLHTHVYATSLAGAQRPRASPHVGLPGGIPRTLGASPFSRFLLRYIGCAGAQHMG